jgi:large subunit ribosomal protein L13
MNKVQEEVIIDAKNKILGRLSTEVADLLRGKGNPSFAPNNIYGVKVVIINAAKIRLTGNKIEQKNYYRHSGYIGNLKTLSLKEAIKNPEFVIRHSVEGMLPKNKLQKEWMKNLTVYEGEK